MRFAEKRHLGTKKRAFLTASPWKRANKGEFLNSCPFHLFMNENLFVHLSIFFAVFFLKKSNTMSFYRYLNIDTGNGRIGGRGDSAKTSHHRPLVFGIVFYVFLYGESDYHSHDSLKSFWTEFHPFFSEKFLIKNQ